MIRQNTDTAQIAVNDLITNEFQEETYIQPEQTERSHNNDPQQTEIIRLIQQYLNNVGYSKVADELASASGILMEPKVVTEFKHEILSKQLDSFRITTLVAQLVRVGILSKLSAQFVEYLLFEQLYLELMESGKTLDAIKLLQTELRQRSQDQSKLHELAQLVFHQKKTTPQSHAIPTTHQETEFNSLSPPNNQIQLVAINQISRKQLISKIQKQLDQQQMLPENRLQCLLQHSVDRQLSLCKFHNCNTENKISLLYEHKCSPNQLPQKCTLTMQRHKDQVWFILFSPTNPNRFATLSKDGSLHIYCILTQNHKTTITQELQIMTYLECVSLQWSQTSDNYIVVGARDHQAYVFNSKDGSMHLKTTIHTRPIQQVVFTRDDQRILVLGLDQRLAIYSIISKQLEDQTMNVKFYEDMAIVKSKDKQQMLAFSGKSTLELRLQDSWKKEGLTIEMDDSIIAITASREGTQLLVNVSMIKPRIELVSFEPDVTWGTTIQKYKGHQQSNFILRPQFGGYQENLVVCGSEDSSVFVWRRDSGDLLQQLKGHYQVVNSVSWSQTHNMLISASDDTTVKVWTMEDIKISLSQSKPAITKSQITRTLRGNDSSDSDDQNKDSLMQEDFKSQESDDDQLMSDNEDDDIEDLDGWEDLHVGMRH